MDDFYQLWWIINLLSDYFAQMHMEEKTHQGSKLISRIFLLV